jgi:hypothetical protein
MFAALIDFVGLLAQDTFKQSFDSERAPISIGKS